MGNGEPKTVRELYFYSKGEFEAIHVDMKSIKKLVWWIAGIMGGAIVGISLNLIKGVL